MPISKSTRAGWLHDYAEGDVGNAAPPEWADLGGIAIDPRRLFRGLFYGLAGCAAIGLTLLAVLAR